MHPPSRRCHHPCVLLLAPRHLLFESCSAAASVAARRRLALHSAPASGPPLPRRQLHQDATSASPRHRAKAQSLNPLMDLKHREMSSYICATRASRTAASCRGGMPEPALVSLGVNLRAPGVNLRALDINLCPLSTALAATGWPRRPPRSSPPSPSPPTPSFTPRLNDLHPAAVPLTSSSRRRCFTRAVRRPGWGLAVWIWLCLARGFLPAVMDACVLAVSASCPVKEGSSR